MRSNNSPEVINGFYILSDGTIIKVHENLKIEIFNGASLTSFNVKEFPTWLHERSIKIFFAELPNQQVALAFSLAKEPSFIVILDLKSGTYIAETIPKKIESIFFLPSEHSLLINAELICSLQDMHLTIKKDQRFLNFWKRANIEHARYLEPYGIYYPIPNESGFIYFDPHHQSTLKLLTNQLEEKKQLRLCHEDYNAFFSNNWLGKGPSCHSSIQYFTFFSDHSMACISVYLDRFTLRYHSYEKRTYYLHILQNNLTEVHKISFRHLVPQQLLVLNRDYIAVIGYYPEHDKKFYTQIAIKIYDARGQQIKKLTMDKSRGRYFISATPDGRIVTCSENGEIIIHHVLNLHEKLQKETHAVLDKFFPKVLIPIVTDYAGFSSDKKGMPKNKFVEKNYPDENSKSASKWRFKF